LQVFSVADTTKDQKSNKAQKSTINLSFLFIF
jgi:hypothetical protein